jgi:hypothetical protein
MSAYQGNLLVSSDLESEAPGAYLHGTGDRDSALTRTWEIFDYRPGLTPVCIHLSATIFFPALYL